MSPQDWHDESLGLNDVLTPKHTCQLLNFLEPNIQGFRAEVYYAGLPVIRARSFFSSRSVEATKHEASAMPLLPQGPCTQIVSTLAPKYAYIGTTVRPRYILFGYMDPWGSWNLLPTGTS